MMRLILFQDVHHLLPHNNTYIHTRLYIYIRMCIHACVFGMRKQAYIHTYIRTKTYAHT